MNSKQNANKPKGRAEILTEFDLHLLAEGSHLRSYEKLGAHLCSVGGVSGASFAVWAPNAKKVIVIGDFNNWLGADTPLVLRPEAGIWEGFVPGVIKGQAYKYLVYPADGGHPVEKADPYAFFSEMRPNSASRVWDIDTYEWGDSAWMKSRERASRNDRPVSIYEVHLGSWMRVPEEGNRFLTYRELARRLPVYVAELGFTHVELMPICEHPLDDSWGYQTLSYFAPTSRFGTPEDFMFLVDAFHQKGIGVILDWVPAHFPRDGHGLGVFDGTHLYEHQDPRKGAHPDWGTYIFNYGRREVANFLLSGALFWLDKYHIDGLRIDAVASMLYLDYSRKEGEWIPNQYGGNENLEAIYFLKRLSETVYEEFPSATTFAEESTSWPMVSWPTWLGGLGFGYKWNMGWMHDVLRYMERDPVYRSYHLEDLTFGLVYAFHENFVLPFSHDEVVHGKGSMLSKMPGDIWRKFANLRLLYSFMYAHPGKKLLFMGSEIGLWDEWNCNAGMEWSLLKYPTHRGVQQLVKDLNRLIRKEAAFFELDSKAEGFSWVDCSDRDSCVISFLRRSKERKSEFLCIFNFTPIVRKSYRVGVPSSGYWKELFNSDAASYGGSDVGNGGGCQSDKVSCHGFEQSLSLFLPPLGAVFLKREG